jgi:hypothetical protein
MDDFPKKSHGKMETGVMESDLSGFCQIRET